MEPEAIKLSKTNSVRGYRLCDSTPVGQIHGCWLGQGRGGGGGLRGMDFKGWRVLEMGERCVDYAPIQDYELRDG